MKARRLMWFDNPPSKKGSKRMARKLYGAAAKAHAKRMARIGGRRRSNPSRKRSKKRSYAVTRYRSNPKKRHSVKAHYAVSRRGKRYHVKRHFSNPRGIINFVMAGAIDATEVVLGKAGVRIVAGYLPASIPQTGAVGLAIQVALATGLGFGAHKFVSPNAGKMVLAGGLSGVIESFIKSLNIPILSPALGDATSYYAVGAYPGVSAYPALPAPGVSAYPGISGDVVDDLEYSMQY